MAQESSFDIVSKVDLQEVKNALGQSMKEVRQRYDFKGSKADIALDENDRRLELKAEDDMKLRSLADILRTKLVKRDVPLKALDFKAPEQAGGGAMRQTVEMQDGIPTEKAREIVKIVKTTKRKVQVAIQSDQVRVSGKKRDDLQAIMALLKESDLGIDMQFVNYR